MKDDRLNADFHTSHPDILHAHLGLATLAAIGEPELEPLDPAFCISERARSNLLRVSWWRD